MQLDILVKAVPSQDQTKKMVEVIIIIKIMPKNLEINLNILKQKAQEKIKAFGADIMNIEEKPVAFGLNSLEIEFVMNENKGATDPLEGELKQIDGVQSADTISVRRLLC